MCLFPTDVSLLTFSAAIGSRGVFNYASALLFQQFANQFAQLVNQFGREAGLVELHCAAFVKHEVAGYALHLRRFP